MTFLRSTIHWRARRPCQAAGSSPFARPPPPDVADLRFVDGFNSDDSAALGLEPHSYSNVEGDALCPGRAASRPDRAPGQPSGVAVRGWRRGVGVARGWGSRGRGQGQFLGGDFIGLGCWPASDAWLGAAWGGFFVCRGRALNHPSAYSPLPCLCSNLVQWAARAGGHGRRRRERSPGAVRRARERRGTASCAAPNTTAKMRSGVMEIGGSRLIAWKRRSAGC